MTMVAELATVVAAVPRDFDLRSNQIHTSNLDFDRSIKLVVVANQIEMETIDGGGMRVGFSRLTLACSGGIVRACLAAVVFGRRRLAGKKGHLYRVRKREEEAITRGRREREPTKIIWVIWVQRNFKKANSHHNLSLNFLLNLLPRIKVLNLQNPNPEKKIQIVVEEGDTTRKVWRDIEDARLCKRWAHISTDRMVGNDQTKEGFWMRVHDDYHRELPTEGYVSTRSDDNLRQHFGDLGGWVKKFQAKLKYEIRKNQSGRNEADMYKAAEITYFQDGGKPFKDHIAYQVLKDQPKWHNKISVITTKKQKNIMSGSTSTDFDMSNDDVNDVEVVSVSRKLERPKGRKAANAASQSYNSTSSVLMEFLANYKAEQDEKKEVSSVNMSIMAQSSIKKASA